MLLKTFWTVLLGPQLWDLVTPRCFLAGSACDSCAHMEGELEPGVGARLLTVSPQHFRLTCFGPCGKEFFALNFLELQRVSPSCSLVLWDNMTHVFHMMPYVNSKSNSQFYVFLVHCIVFCFWHFHFIICRCPSCLQKLSQWLASAPRQSASGCSRSYTFV